MAAAKVNKDLKLSLIMVKSEISHNLIVFKTTSPHVISVGPARETLYEGARRIRWPSWLGPESTIAVDASSHKSEMEHTGFMAQVVKDELAMGDNVANSAAEPRATRTCLPLW